MITLADFQSNIDPLIREIFALQVRPAMQTWRSWVRVGANNLETYKANILGAGDAFEPVAEGQPFPEMTLYDHNSKTFTMVNYAKRLPITQRALKYDYINRFKDKAMYFARSYTKTLAKCAYSMLVGGFSDTGPDSVSTFNDSHPISGSSETWDNLITAALSMNALDTAFEYIMDFVDDHNDPLELNPEVDYVLAVPPALAGTAKQLLIGRYGQDALNAENLRFKNLGLDISPYLGAKQGGSDTAWYLVPKAENVDNTCQLDFLETVDSDGNSVSGEADLVLHMPEAASTNRDIAYDSSADWAYGIAGPWGLFASTGGG